MYKMISVFETVNNRMNDDDIERAHSVMFGGKTKRHRIKNQRKSKRKRVSRKNVIKRNKSQKIK